MVTIESLIKEIKALRETLKVTEGQQARNRILDQIHEKRLQVTQLMHLAKTKKIL